MASTSQPRSLPRRHSDIDLSLLRYSLRGTVVPQSDLNDKKPGRSIIRFIQVSPVSGAPKIGFPLVEATSQGPTASPPLETILADARETVVIDSLLESKADFLLTMTVRSWSPTTLVCDIISQQYVVARCGKSNEGHSHLFRQRQQGLSLSPTRHEYPSMAGSAEIRAA